ncbi:transcriptional regulator, HxlR family [Archaeoglobus sulfaticallidus PM70-1]|uniref:Transcriptional regulator, HxlR family n=1 Tax=Archaeoglobus sulfaticallidus PM70-1 TaxID=387631 RepID=N0BL90_9EURY|nr:winged helix-turn-helix transcriptional regulator [Archaeoglobus sulfaticallidus]AGK60965.1 transcriptional regulator, HxlR family [Archaeoglobus sulfaticallidus PM70-1]
METIYALAKKITKKTNMTILFSLKDSPKRWSELEKSIYKKDLHKGIKELLDLGLIQITLRFDTPTGSKAYELSPLGKKIVQLLEQIEEEYTKYHSKAPQKDPEKFINELLEKD